MFTIYQNTKKEGLDLETFEQRMITICNQHRDDKKALAFAFILYDFENPNIRKVLNDNDYWEALNQISGNYLSVFSLNYKEKEIPTSYDKTNFNGLQMLTSIPTRYNPSIGTNQLIKKYFGDIDSINYPAILFFQIDNNSVIDSILLDLNEQQIESSYLELKEVIKAAVNALKNITLENEQNYIEIFNCLENEVKSNHKLRKIKRFAKNSGNIISLIASIKGLL